ncbi:MAG TPA: citrate (Si)-synthase [Bacteroidota bacterium]|jgi:citrate synthase|nr:citrate (Si)-synthase [Bacteroidota bacterium]
MATLKERLSELIPIKRDILKNLSKQYGSTVISQVTVDQALGGLRGITCLLCDTSSVELDKGLIIREIPIRHLTDKTPEEIFFLLTSSEKPDNEGLEDLRKELKLRSEVPSYVYDVLKAMPKDSHPMTMFSTAILSMQKESVFYKEYQKGLKKEYYWEYILEDALNILARVTSIAAFIYRYRYDKGDRIPYNPDLDYSSNFANMLGIDDPNGDFKDLIRLYLVLHSDHESGNVSAFTTSVVSSALSDPYLAVSAGLNGLAGPLHGLANQECLRWILQVYERFNGVPSDDDLRQYAWDTLKSGQVIPGYGHAVLRVTDPRFTAFLNFGKKYMPDDEIFRIVEKVFEIVPQVLIEQGKAKDPWPNVDAASGVLLYHYGIKEFDYYTVLFGVSRIMGMLAQTIYNRAMMLPIIRPKSFTTEWLKRKVAQPE